MIDAGRVGFVLKGAYNALATYEMLDVVTYQNSSYVAKQTTTGNPPTDTTNWQYLTNVPMMTGSVFGIGKPDGVTTTVSGGVFSAMGSTIIATINPIGTELGADWLLDENGIVIIPSTKQEYRVNVNGKELIYFWDGSVYAPLGGGGHTIVGTQPVTQRANLRFDLFDVSDDPTNDTTVIHGQIEEKSQSEWESMTTAEKDNPNKAYMLPWLNAGSALVTENIPIGFVGYVTSGDGTGDTEKIIPEGWLECDGTVYSISDYPKLAKHFEDTYGASDRFGGNGTTTFAVPTYTYAHTDSIVIIKAKMTTYKMFAGEIDDVECTEDNVWSAAKVNTYIHHITRRDKRDISSRLSDGSLSQAILEGDLAKYGYAIGDYFESPTERTLTNEAYENNTLTQSDVAVKLRYYLADLDTYYGGYNSYAIVDQHHIGIVVDTKVRRQWHSGNVDSVGYKNSKLHAFLSGTGNTTKNYQAFRAISADIQDLTGDSVDSHLIKHAKVFTQPSAAGQTNAMTNWSWIENQYIAALSEAQMYGSTIWSLNGYQTGEAARQLEIFRKYSWMDIYGNTWMWLKDIQSASSACGAGSSGRASDRSVVAADRASGLILYK